MAAKIEVRVPDIGDFDEVEVIEIMATPGQVVALEEGLLTLETDKAAMDIPSPQAGTLLEVTVSAGDKVSQGDVIAIIETDDASQGSEPTQMLPGLSDSDAETVMLPQLVEMNVPNIGDFEGVEVIEVNISAGDQVEIDTPLVTLETDKATMEVPSEVSGVIKEVLVKVGDKVSTGQAVALCESQTASQEESMPAEARIIPSPEPAVSSQPAQPITPPPVASAQASPAALPPIVEGTFKLAHASPGVRKFARELGVDLGRVQGKGVKGRISKDDIKAFVKSVLQGGAQPVAGGGSALPALPKVDHAKFGAIELQPLSRIQKISGPRLHASWVNIPHVTHNDLSDFTETEALRKTLKSEALERGIRLTPLAFVMRACAIALGEFPLFNSSLSDDGEALVMKDYINLGFAADTPNGLVVPVVHNAQSMNVMQLAEALGDLSLAARDGKLKADKMRGGSFTVSSLGGIGGVSFTPIINPPEVAILGVSRSSIQPQYIDQQFQPRLMLPLSLSYDHRVIDGASAARFTARLAELMSQPDELLAS